MPVKPFIVCVFVRSFPKSQQLCFCLNALFFRAHGLCRYKRKRIRKKLLGIAYKRRPGDGVTLSKKREVVRWSLQNAHKVPGGIDAVLMKQFPGIYKSRRLAHWKQAYYRFQWLVCAWHPFSVHSLVMAPKGYCAAAFCQPRWENIPDKLAKWLHVPNSWAQKFGHAKLKGPSRKRFELPDSLADVLEQKIMELSSGPNATMRRSEPINYADVTASMRFLIDEYNAEIEKLG